MLPLAVPVVCGVLPVARASLLRSAHPTAVFMALRVSMSGERSTTAAVTGGLKALGHETETAR